VRQISQEIKRLDSDARSVERLAAQVGKKKQLVMPFGASRPKGALLPSSAISPTPCPRRVAPGIEHGRQGVELIGQAGTASALILPSKPRRGSTTSSSPRP